ncbi:hypothetical protein niasHT_006214 [Heterodera trifolii]|uniref:Uncharacterized protein n=1 Tax=Heterodera trifolii TaxID=157864 RepID=A0ABD2M108_9BILA
MYVAKVMATAVRECVEQYKPLFVFSTENLRAARLTKVRQHFKQNLWIFFAKKQFEAVALGKSTQDEQVFRRAHRG